MVDGGSQDCCWQRGSQRAALEALFQSGSDVYRVCYKCGVVRPKDTSTSYVAGIGVGG